jgi:hypothetical protein
VNESAKVVLANPEPSTNGTSCGQKFGCCFKANDRTTNSRSTSDGAKVHGIELQTVRLNRIVGISILPAIKAQTCRVTRSNGPISELCHSQKSLSVGDLSGAEKQVAFEFDMA